MQKVNVANDAMYCPSEDNLEHDASTVSTRSTSGDSSESESQASNITSAGLKQRKPKSSKAVPSTPTAKSGKATKNESRSSPFKIMARCRSFLALFYLWAFAPVLLSMAFIAWLRHVIFGKKRAAPKKQLRVLVTGGKMTKASAVARAVGRDGHTVFTAEILPYRFCHTRFVRYVSKHFVLPRPTVDPEAWLAKMKGIVNDYGIDLIIPCTAPVESSAYAHLREQLPAHVRVFAFDGETSDVLDNKYTFNQVLVKAGLPCPETANMECLDDAVEFFKKRPAAGSKNDDGKRFIVKPAVYDPKARTEILFLPIEDSARQLEYLQSRNASKRVPYVIQEVLQEPELGSYALFNKGALTGFEFFKSAASCLVYQQAEGKNYNAVLELNRGLGKSMNLTGQLTLDLMYTPTGDMVPIECNPRIHSAVCTLEGHENLGRTFTDPDFTPSANADVVTSQKETFRYWIMDQMFLMAGFWKPKNCFKLNLREMMKGNDAMLAGDDPLPFLAMYLVQIPSLLALELICGSEWLKVDFCIGKIVKEGGD